MDLFWDSRQIDSSSRAQRAAEGQVGRKRRPMARRLKRPRKVGIERRRAFFVNAAKQDRV